MLTIEFAGWFQCRLATDPDPYDEPRGVSGYVRAYAGEPDLDRIIHWQPPTFLRALAPTVGVSVSRVFLDGKPVEGSPLAGARVMLHGSPKFEGRNGVVAEDRLRADLPVRPRDKQRRDLGAPDLRSLRLIPFHSRTLSPGIDLGGAAENSESHGNTQPPGSLASQIAGAEDEHGAGRAAAHGNA